MKILFFGVFTQLLDMVTTWWGLVHGAIERNHLLPSFLGGIVIIKLSVIVLMVATYILYKWTKQSMRFFNVVLAVPSLYIFNVGMTNLSLLWK